MKDERLQLVRGGKGLRSDEDLRGGEDFRGWRVEDIQAPYGAAVEPQQEVEFHHIWKNLLFEHRGLETREGKRVQILHPGSHNHHQGPDFLQAKIHMDGMAFSGDAELHLHGNEWSRHGHGRDPGYNGVVLHVVMERGQAPPLRQDGSPIPEICLEGRLKAPVAPQRELMGGFGKALPCASWLENQQGLRHAGWLSRLGNDRLRRKALALRTELQALKGDWAQLTWEALARYLAGPVNAAPFAALAKALPYRIVHRYAVKQDRLRLEALLFGVAGTLSGGPPLDDYHALLREEWGFLAHKHQLRAQPVALRFHRMRPPSFPTIRLSQLAGIALAFPGLAHLLSPGGAAAFADCAVGTSPYWEAHTRFGKAARPGKRGLGRGFRERLLANTLLPIGTLYREAHGLAGLRSARDSCLIALPPEDNKIVRSYQHLDIRPTNALESQGLIELKKEFCDARRCLECRIGRQILNGNGS